MLNYIKLIRPINLLLALISAKIAIHILNISIGTPQVYYSFLAVGAFLAGSNILNDIFDIKTDKVNRPNKPIPTGKINVTNAGISSLLLFSIGIFAVNNVQPLGINLVVFIVFPILVLYTPIFKGIPFIGNFMVSFLLGSVFIFIEAALTNMIAQMWFPAILAFHLTLNREVIKDLEDMTGDQIANIITLPILKGVKWSINSLIYSSILLIIWPVIAINLGAAGKFSLYVYLIGFLPVFISTVIYLFLKKEHANFRILSIMLKIATIIGMIVIYAIPY